jgi:hypothetical protein
MTNGGNNMRSIIALVLTLALVAPALAATPFADVPKTHWAYDAISQAVDAGILQGYDGKFHGQRLLNRYQMAVIVAKILDNVKPGAPAAGRADNKTLANIEALTTEFADELALLNTKVTTLEGTTQELKRDLEAMKGNGGGAATGNGLGFTAFAQVGLIMTDDGTSTVGPPLPNVTRYTNDSEDSLFFTLPQASIGIDKEVNPGVYFHAQFDYASDVNDGLLGNSGLVGINEAYFFVDEILGDIGGKIGAFAGPFSMEHNGPFRTCNYTITPSLVNTANEAWRGYGLEFQRTKDVKPGDIMWKVGVVSGTDNPAGNILWSDQPVQINANNGEADDGIGFYLWIGKKPEKKGFGWNIGYFNNGGDPNIVAPDPHTPSDEIKAWQVGFEWWGDKFGVMGQYLDASLDDGPGIDEDATAWYLLVNFEVNEKNNVTLRYDDGSIDNGGGLGVDAELTGITFAWNHKVTENSLFQFEYLAPDNEVGPVAVDADDDIVQIRYKVHF